VKTIQLIKLLGLGSYLTVAAFVAPVAVDKAARLVGVETNLVSQAHAQNKKKKTRRLPGLSERMIKQMGLVSELISPDTQKDSTAKPNFPEALKALDKLIKGCKDKCNGYEIGQIYRLYGYTYYSMDNIDKAIQSYTKVVDQTPNIPVGVELEALYTLSQFTWSKDRFDDSLKFLKRWIKLANEYGTEVNSDVYFFLGTVYYSKNDKKNAIVNVDRAVTMVEGRGKNAKEQWYNLQMALYLEKENYRKGKSIVEKLIRHYPKASYWVQFANINGVLEREKDQLHALDAVDVMGQLDKRQDIVNLTYTYLNNDVPYKAAKLLSRGIKERKVEKNVKYMTILASAWRAAREYKKAIAVLNDTAKVAKKEDSDNRGKKGYKREEGNIYAELTALYLDVDDSKSAVNAGKKAISAGSLKRACDVHTHMGMAYVDMGQYKSAVSAFEKAQADKKCKAIVSSWIRYAQNEQRQQEELARSML